MPPCSWSNTTETPPAGLPVVPLRTVPLSVPPADTHGAVVVRRSAVVAIRNFFMDEPDRDGREPRGAVSRPRLRLRFLPAPRQLRSQAPASFLRNPAPSISRRDSRT